MVSAWRVAMPFHMCENRHSNRLPVSLEVTSKAPTNVLMAPLLARTGRDVTLPQFSAFSCQQSVVNPYRLTATASGRADRKSTRLNSSHTVISYAVFCLKTKNGCVV